MKKLLLLMLAIGLFSCGDDEEITLECLPTNLQQDVVAIYPFNEGSLIDYSGNSHDLTNTTAAAMTADRNGNANCAYMFDNTQNTQEFLTTTDSDFLNGMDEFSVSLWYQPIDVTNSGVRLQGMFSRGNKTRCPDRMGEWSMSLYDCRRAVFGHDNSAWAEAVTNFVDGCEGEVEALVDKWHHVVGIKNGADYKIYFNGVLDETASGDANCTVFQSAQNIGDIFVGYNFMGKLDDIIVYKRELSQTEVEDLYSLEPCCK